MTLLAGWLVASLAFGLGWSFSARFAVAGPEGLRRKLAAAPLRHPRARKNGYLWHQACCKSASSLGITAGVGLSLRSKHIIHEAAKPLLHAGASPNAV